MTAWPQTSLKEERAKTDGGIILGINMIFDIFGLILESPIVGDSWNHVNWFKNRHLQRWLIGIQDLRPNPTSSVLEKEETMKKGQSYTKIIRMWQSKCMQPTLNI